MFHTNHISLLTGEMPPCFDCLSFQTIRRAVCRIVWAVLVLSGGWFPFSAYAQQDVAFMQYHQVETQWNPAAAGRSPQLTVNAALQTHAAGFENAGSTMWAGADMAFAMGTTRHGVGAMFLNDAIGLFSHKRFALQYAYHQKLYGGILSVGLQADMLQEEIDGTKADLADGNDPAFPSAKLTGSAFDLSAGAGYTRRSLHLGISMLRLTAPTVLLGESNELEVKSLLNFSGGYNIKLNHPFYTITPSAMLRTDFTDYRLDLTLRGQYEFEKRKLSAGLNYAPGRSVGLFVGGTFRGIDLSYGYEANTAGLGLSAGQHEITLTYRLNLDLGKKGRNLHKSVRWL